WLSVAWVAASCGHRKSLVAPPGDDDAGAAAPDAGAPDASAPDAPPDATYYGFVLAKLTEAQADGTGAGAGATYGAFANFLQGANPTSSTSCRSEWASAGSCCCMPGFLLSLPGPRTDAATVTIASGDGASVLATVAAPSSATLYETSDLGLAWEF